jgi:hypothetical protein
MPVTLEDLRFRVAPFRVVQSATYTGRRVHRPYPLRRLAHLVLNSALESVLGAEPGPTQRMFEDGVLRISLGAPLAQQLIRKSEELRRMRLFCRYQGR